MRKYLFFALMAGAIVLAACDDLIQPDPGEWDWCYSYNFAVSDYGFDITVGTWIDGEGISTVGDGLSVNYSKPGLFVTPGVAVVYLKKTIADGIKIQSDGTIYGIPVNINGTPLWNEDNTASSGGLTPLGEGDGGTQILVNIQSDPDDAISGPADVIVQRLEIYGDGASPFESNPCGPDQPTGTPTETATMAATASATSTSVPSNTPTRTLSPTPTSPLSCTVTYDFTVSDAGWTGIANYDGTADFGSWSSGVGFVGVDARNNVGGYSRMVFISKTIPTATITAIDLHFTRGGGTIVNGNEWWRIQADGTNLANNTSPATGSFVRSWSGSRSASSIQVLARASLQTTASYSGSVTVTSVSVTGNFPSCNPTFTPTPTHTATDTTTPLPTSTATASRTPLFTSPPGGATSTRTPSRTPIMVFTPTPRPNTSTPVPTVTSIPPSLPPPPTLAATPTFITATPQTYTPEASSTINPVTGTPFGTPGGTPWGTPSLWGTPFEGAPTALMTLEGFPTFQAPDYGGVYDFMTTAVAAVGSLPLDISGSVPQVSSGPLFAYAKWTLSCASVQELMGQTLSTPVCHALVGVSLNILLAGILLTIRFVRLAMRAALWIFTTILKFIPFMG